MDVPAKAQGSQRCQQKRHRPVRAAHQPQTSDVLLIHEQEEVKRAIIASLKTSSVPLVKVKRPLAKRPPRSPLKPTPVPVVRRLNSTGTTSDTVVNGICKEQPAEADHSPNAKHINTTDAGNYAKTADNDGEKCNGYCAIALPPLPKQSAQIMPKLEIKTDKGTPSRHSAKMEFWEKDPRWGTPPAYAITSDSRKIFTEQPHQEYDDLDSVHTFVSFLGLNALADSIRPCPLPAEVRHFELMDFRVAQVASGSGDAAGSESENDNVSPPRKKRRIVSPKKSPPKSLSLASARKPSAKKDLSLHRLLMASKRSVAKAKNNSLRRSPQKGTPPRVSHVYMTRSPRRSSDRKGDPSPTCSPGGSVLPKNLFSKYAKMRTPPKAMAQNGSKKKSTLSAKRASPNSGCAGRKSGTSENPTRLSLRHRPPVNYKLDSPGSSSLSPQSPARKLRKD